MTTNTDINSLAQRLRDAALKATKGLWYRAMMRFNGITTNEITSVLFHGEAEAIIASTVEKRDAEFIALANPINIQLILNALESAQRQVTHLEKCLSEQENISSGFHVGLKYASARIKELEVSQPVVPEGWKLVPLKATKAMKDACDYTPGPMTGYMAWKVMIEAAPVLQEE